MFVYTIDESNAKKSPTPLRFAEDFLLRFFCFFCVSSLNFKQKLNKNISCSFILSLFLLLLFNLNVKYYLPRQSLVFIITLCYSITHSNKFRNEAKTAIYLKKTSKLSTREPINLKFIN